MEFQASDVLISMIYKTDQSREQEFHMRLFSNLQKLIKIWPELCGPVVFVFTMTCVSFPVSGQITAWSTETSKTSMRDMQILGDSLVIATGGGILIFNVAQGQFDAAITNSEGLSQNQTVKIIIDSGSSWWVGLQNGHLNRFGEDAANWDLFRDFEDLTIHDMQLRGDSLFVALDIGVSLFLLGKQEVKETYKNLGDIPIEVDAWSTLIHWPNLYVGSDFGLSVADLRQINLKAPQSWTNYDETDGLAGNAVTAIAYHDGVVFVGTSAGVQTFENDVFNPVNTSLPTQEVTEFYAGYGSLHAAVGQSIYQYDSAGDSWDLELNLGVQITTFLISPQGDFWIGTDGAGLVRWDPGQGNPEYFFPNGPAGNSFVDSIVDSEGRLWCASASLSGDGVYRFEGSAWTNYSAIAGDFPINETVSLVEDPAGNIWIGTWGAGVYRFAPDGEISVFDETDGRLNGIPNDLSFVVVNAIDVDQEGILWMTNFGAFNGNKLVAATPGGEWIQFGSGNGVSGANPICLAIDQFNRKWVGTDGSGIYVYDDNRSVSNLSDDVVGTLTQSDGLSSNIILDLVFDDFGVLWIATNEGLEFYQNGEVRSQFGLITTDINAIEVDPVGNKWVGTSSGFSILNRDDFTWTHFTTENSPLVNSNVTSFSFNAQTGAAYIGTTNGLSIAQTLFVEPAETLTQLKLFPNPFMTGSGSTVTIDGLSRDCDVNIYTAGGFLVKELVQGSRGGRATWDGTNTDGRLVPSGIYLAVAVEPDGTSKSGKVAVINP